MSAIAQALVDKQFLEARPEDQKAYIAHIDPEFAKAAKEDQEAYYSERVLPAIKEHSKQINAPGVTTRFEQTPRELREAAVGKAPSRLERIRSEIAGGAASALSGAPETPHPLRDLYRQMGSEGEDMMAHPVRTALSPINPVENLKKLYGLVRPIGEGLYDIGRGAGEELGLVKPEETGEPRGLERIAHGTGTVGGVASQFLTGGKVAEGAGITEGVGKIARNPEGKLRPIVSILGRGAGAAAGHAAGIPEGGLIGALYGHKLLDAIIPDRVPAAEFPGAHLPASDEFYENAGAERLKDFERTQKAETIARREAEQKDREIEAGHKDFANRVSQIEDARQDELSTQGRLRHLGEQERAEAIAREESGHRDFANRLSKIESNRQTELANEGRLRRIAEREEKQTPKAPESPESGERFPETKRLPESLTRSIDEANNVRRLEPNKPLREQVEPIKEKPNGNGAETKDTLKEKYPDAGDRQMVRANGEKIFEAVGKDKDLMKQIHDLTRVDLRQALINAGEDMGQQTVSNSRFAGEGSITREQAFNRLLELGKKPKEIVKLAKPDVVYRVHDTGKPEMDLERSQAHATSSLEEAKRYAETRNGGVNQTISQADLSAEEGKNYTRFKGPNGQDWIRFHRQIRWKPYQP